MIWFVIGVGSGSVRIAIAEQYYSDSTWSMWECVKKNVIRRFGSEKNAMLTVTFSIISLSQ